MRKSRFLKTIKDSRETSTFAQVQLLTAHAAQQQYVLEYCYFNQKTTLDYAKSVDSQSTPNLDSDLTSSTPCTTHERMLFSVTRQ